MKIKTKKAAPSLFKAAKRALHELTCIEGWDRCDDETGEECRGLNCGHSEHRAAAILSAAIAAHEPPNVVISVSGGVCEVDEDESEGDYTYEIRDFDNCSECGGVDCSGGHRAVEVHGHATGENQ